MEKIPKISESEWEIMKVVWAKSPITASEVIDALAGAEEWHPKTVKTFLNRLTRKGALDFKKEGRAYLYRPLVKEQDCVKAETQSFLERVFGGSLKPMFAHFAQHRRLSREEVEELKRILDQKSK